MLYILMLFSIRLVKVKQIWLTRILGIEAFRNRGVLCRAAGALAMHREPYSTDEIWDAPSAVATEPRHRHRRVDPVSRRPPLISITAPHGTMHAPPPYPFARFRHALASSLSRVSQQQRWHTYWRHYYLKKNNLAVSIYRPGSICWNVTSLKSVRTDEPASCFLIN